MSEILIKDIEQKMINSINHLVDEFSTIRTGRANPSLVDKLNVEYDKVSQNLISDVSIANTTLLKKLNIKDLDNNLLSELLENFDKNTEAYDKIIKKNLSKDWNGDVEKNIMTKIICPIILHL